MKFWLLKIEYLEHQKRRLHFRTLVWLGISACFVILACMLRDTQYLNLALGMNLPILIITIVYLDRAFAKIERFDRQIKRIKEYIRKETQGC